MILIDPAGRDPLEARLALPVNPRLRVRIPFQRVPVDEAERGLDRLSDSLVVHEHGAGRGAHAHFELSNLADVPVVVLRMEDEDSRDR